MTLIYKVGNLVEATEPIIVHGCNAQGVMGSGVAKAIKETFPEAFRAYRERYEKQGGLNLGQVVWATVRNSGTPRHVGNAITQVNYGRDGRRYVEYEAIEHAFATVAGFIRQNRETLGDGPFVGIPRIGAGLGGGDWGLISERIKEAMGEFDVVVYDWG